jgi:hypothetical protein
MKKKRNKWVVMNEVAGILSWIVTSYLLFFKDQDPFEPKEYPILFASILIMYITGLIEFWLQNKRQ